jgi:cytochrome c oxidase subunit III
MDHPNGGTNDRSPALHPYNIFLTLLLASITVLFLAFSAAFVYSRVESGMPAIELPTIFFFNTLILVGSSFTIRWAKQCYINDSTELYQLALLSTIILTIVFMICQYIGWKELFSQELFLGTDISLSYLYLISGLHFAHVLTGLPFLILFLNTARKRMEEPVSVLVYFSDPKKRLKLKLLTIYWHFLDILWIYLVLFFFINSLIDGK